MNGRQITKLKIKGFKSIKECELDLRMINVIIGSNGSGKTNFISLFYLLQNMIDGNLQFYISKHGGPNAFLHYGSKQTEKMSAEFYFGSNGYQFELSPTADDRMMYDGEWFYWEISGKMKLGGGYFESKWQEGCGNNIDRYVQPILRDQKWRVYHFHDTGDASLVKQIHGINDNIELAADARNLAAFLYRLKTTEGNSYNQIVKAVRLVAPYFDDFILRPNPLRPDSIRLEWKDIYSDVPFVAAQLSDGTLRFICLATLFLQPDYMMPETILVDEPELGLHPYAISILASLIKRAATKKQIILSTQSVELLNQFAPEDVIVADHKGEQSVFSRLNAEQLTMWLEDDYSLGDLWKKNILGGRP